MDQTRLLFAATILVVSLVACSRSAPPAEPKSAAAGSQRTSQKAAAAQTALEKGMADRLQKNAAACTAGDQNACAYSLIAKKFQELRVDCDRGDAGACDRVVNMLRKEDYRAEMVERCEEGYTRGCLMLADYYRVIGPDTAKVAEYQEIAETQLKAASK